MPPPPKIFWILTPLSPLSWVSESYRQDIGRFQVFSSDEALQRGELFHQGQFPCCSQDMEQGAGPNHFLDLKLESLFYY